MSLPEFGKALAHAVRTRELGTMNVTRVVNSLPPAERAAAMHIARSYDFANSNPDGQGGRLMPFGERVTTQDVTRHYELDPQVAKTVFQKMEDEALTAGLMARMGTDASRNNNQPATLREQIGASFDANT